MFPIGNALTINAALLTDFSISSIHNFEHPRRYTVEKDF